MLPGPKFKCKDIHSEITILITCCLQKRLCQSHISSADEQEINKWRKVHHTLVTQSPRSCIRYVQHPSQLPARPKGFSVQIRGSAFCFLSCSKSILSFILNICTYPSRAGESHGNLLWVDVRATGHESSPSLRPFQPCLCLRASCVLHFIAKVRRCHPFHCSTAGLPDPRLGADIAIFSPLPPIYLQKREGQMLLPASQISQYHLFRQIKR